MTWLCAPILILIVGSSVTIWDDRQRRGKHEGRLIKDRGGWQLGLVLIVSVYSVAISTYAPVKQALTATNISILIGLEYAWAERGRFKQKQSEQGGG